MPATGSSGPGKMAELPEERLYAFRSRTFRSAPENNVKTLEEAVDFVNRRGYILFWPAKGHPFPSLWVSVAGDRPVSDHHDDPGHVTWGWKDAMLGQKRWYYGKVLRKRATLISLEILPYFYALSENYGEPEEDHLILYEQGLLTAEAKAIYEAIVTEGPLDTIALRRAARLSSAGTDSAFNRALTELQADFKLMPVGVSQAGAWRYAFIYEIVARHHPEVIDQARFISDKAAREALALRYFEALGASTTRALARLFNWRDQQAQSIVQALCDEGHLVSGIAMPEGHEAGVALPELCVIDP
jgi:hypothetical protein